jgi:uncharacterized membrane protein YjfL (UPF0719 family)
MGFFNLIETSFFVSLAITFILVFLLVYFFKQKLNVLETKYDAMLTIVGNVVKEVNILRQAIMHTSVLHNMNSPASIVVNTVPHQTHQYPMHTIEELIESESDSETHYSEDEEDDREDKQNIHMIREECTMNEPYELDREESDSEYESESDSDSEVNEELILDNLEEYPELNRDDDIKFDATPIELDIDTTISPSLDIVSTLEIPESISHEYLEETIAIDSEEPSVPTYSGPDGLLDITYEQEELEETVEKQIPENEEKESYKKMNIHQLKSLVMAKGLASDASKMKKNELIRILEGSQ